MTGVVIGLVATLLAASALLAAAGTAVLQVGTSRVRTLLEEGFKGAEALGALRDETERTRSALDVIGSALNLTAVGVATLASELVWGGLTTIGILLGAIVLVIFVTGMAPRAIAGRHPVRLALFSAPALLVLTRWHRKLASPLLTLERVLLGSADDAGTHDERELKAIQELGQEEGVLEEHENLLVERAFRLDELTAYDVMTPRVDIFAWSDSLTLKEIMDQLAGVPYTRVPVYGESVDDITGVLHLREAFQAYVDGAGDQPISELAREPFFVPGSASLSRLLRDFQSRRMHIGIVADEFGGVDGLVTLEDVIEELVGEIVDETDVDEEELLQVSATEALADAGMDLRDLNEGFGVTLPVAENRSLNGFILEELGYVPAVGEVLERSGVRIEVVEATDTHVLRARLLRLPGGDGQDDEG